MTGVDQAVAPRGLGRDFGLMSSAYAIQTLGEGVMVTALPLVASMITTDPKLISWVLLAWELPWLLLALPGGLIVDRFDRRRLMVIAQCAQMGLLVVLAAAVTFDFTQLWMLYLLAFGLGAGDIIFIGASRALLPDIVDESRLETANGRNMTAETLGRNFVGPPLGSALFAFLLPLPFWLNAVTYLLSVLLILRIRHRAPERAAAEPGARGRVLSDLTAGLRWLVQHPVLRIVVLLAAVSNFCVIMGQSVLVLFAKQVLAVGDTFYGVLVAAMAVGGVVGGLFSGKVVVRFGTRAVAITVSLAGALSLLAIGALGRQPVVVAALFCVWSAGLALWNVMAQSLSQRLIPDELRGRVNSASRMICFGALPLGALAGGLVADSVDLSAPWLVGGAVNLVVVLLTIPKLLKWPSARTDSTPQDVPS
ncbi:MFS transporter [Actinokineospora sp. HUAS TT18]|uniref:MFS transporter n=1 Tax=Actinokineospora sp. HUAS TT18 TaxID=3447451 RepID=UPI003F51FD18